ncbi:MAG: N-acetyltransferase, partial [Bacilli bacterium]|nr:N-acetyltransferase [Bacilli bacterium]
MIIKSMKQKDDRYISQAAQLLVNGFKDICPHVWCNLESALEEVNECLNVDRICRIAIDEHDNVMGWIGG